MGIAHGHGRKPVLLSVYLNGLVYHYFIKQHRYLFRLKYGLSHIDTHGIDLAVFYVQLKIFNAAQCVNGYFGFIDDALVI